MDQGPGEHALVKGPPGREAAAAGIPHLTGSEMGGRVSAFDWASSPLGPIEAWPPSLRVAVGVCLNSRFPMFVWWGPELINIYNDAYVPILGKRHPAALGRPARQSWDEIWPVIGPQAEAVMVRGEATWNDRVLLVMERNEFEEETYFTWSYSPIPDETGVVRGLFCACTEETPRVLAERERDRLMAELSAERARLTNAFRQSPAFMCILRGPAHVFEFVNDEYYRLVGDREIVGKPLREALPEVAGQGFLELLDGVYRTGEAHVGRDTLLMLRRRAGPALDERYVDFVYQPLREADGGVGGIFVHGVDVTEHRRAEQALRESERRFRDMADAAPAMLWITEADGRCTFLSRGWYEFTGQSGDAGLGFGWLDAVHPDDRPIAAEAFFEATRARRGYAVDVRFRRADGAYRWAIDSARPRFGADGQFLGFIGSVIDIEERKRAEEAVREARDMAESANRAKDNFLAVLSHELRTPLTPVLASASALEHDPELPAAIREELALIRRNVQTEARLIDDLLDLTRISRGKVALEQEVLDVHATLRAVIGIVAGAAEEKGLALVTDLAAARHHVWGDPGRVQQVFLNLLQNAVKFTPAGGEVEVRTADAGGRVRVDVRDTGVGIAPDVLPRVFDAFEQGAPSQARRFGGLGLGLAIAKSLVELHAGRIVAASEGDGRGATFTVELEAVAVDEATRPLDADGRPTGAAAAAPQSAADAPARILLVEDHADTLTVMSRLLRGMGHVVRTAGGVASAVAAARAEPFDVLVSDIGLPDGTGLDVIRAVRDVRPDVPGVALSGYGMAEDVRRSRAAGFGEHLVKPVNAATLRAAIGRVMARAGAR